MILGLGLDLTEVARFEKAVYDEHFLERIYTGEERAQIALKGAETAAGYFAAREAVAKALGTGFDQFCPWHISVRCDGRGKPEAVLTGGALERLKELGGGKLTISITHSGGVAAAVAVLSRD